MATRAETRAIYAAAVAQGIALVTFPAASTVFTDPAEYDLSNTQYGMLFIPQVVTAITAALLGAGLGGRFGTKRIYLGGLAAGLAAMTLLVVSAFFTSDQSVAYPMLLVATACLGAGFGLCAPALNTFAAAFNAGAVDRAILAVNALLGVGTVLAPVFVAIFLGLDAWWGLPVTAGALLGLLLFFSIRLPLRVETRAHAARSGVAIPSRFWVYAGFAVLYGVCETVNGNWSQLDMTREVGASATTASLALTAFWAMVTAGRVFFAAVQRTIPPRTTYHALPFLLAAAFVLISILGNGDTVLGVIAFGVAGIGCSALLPLTISFGQEELVAISAGVAGGVIAFYQLGYGLAAFGIGPLLDRGVSLSSVYACSAAIAVVLGACSFVVSRRADWRDSPTVDDASAATSLSNPRP